MLIQGDSTTHSTRGQPARPVATGHKWHVYMKYFIKIRRIALQCITLKNRHKTGYTMKHVIAPFKKSATFFKALRSIKTDLLIMRTTLFKLQ